MIRFINALLLVLALVSALFLINIRNQTRDSFVELSKMQQELDSMKKEYQQLETQQATLIQTQRVHSEAHKQRLANPTAEQLKVIDAKKEQ